MASADWYKASLFPPQAGEMEVHNPLFQDDPTPKGK